MTIRLAVISILAFSVCGAAAWLFVDFQRDIGASRERLEGASKVIQTRSGPIEYAESGEGPAVLIVHGAGGGFDQGLELAESLASGGFRVIAMSRFGYLGTPMPADASVAAQAEAHLNLLDALSVKKAAIFGVSAGGPSALQFAVSHPDRCTALILMVPLAYRPPEIVASVPRPSSHTERILMTLVGSDFAFWLGTRFIPSLVAWTVLGTPAELINAAGKEEQLRARTFAKHILPVSRRVKGIFHDATISESLKRLDLEGVKPPALLISARDDLYGTFASTEYTAKAIPGSKFIPYETGGHMLIAHAAEVTSEVLFFLKANASK